MKKYKNIFTAVVIFCLMSVIVEAAILDQQQLLKDGSRAFWGDNQEAQTFTPSITGKLEKVYLELGGSTDLMVHVSIAEWNTNPLETVLGVSDFYLDDFTGFVDFSSQNIILNAGSLYGIILANDISIHDDPRPGITGYTRKGDDPYARGSAWFSQNWGENWTESTWSDMVFATYMVPEPASLLLLGLGGLALRLKWRR